MGAPPPSPPLWVGDGSWGRNPAYAGTTGIGGYIWPCIGTGGST